MTPHSESDIHNLSPKIATRFFQDIAPFNQLDEITLQQITRHCRLDFFPKGTKILSAGKSDIKYLYLIQRGAVNAFIIDEEGQLRLKDVRGEGQFFGALGIIQNSKANLDVETVEDTFCLLLPKQILLDLIEKNPVFAQYYLKSFSDQLVNNAYSQFRSLKLKRRNSEDLYLFSNTVDKVIRRSAHVIDTTTTIRRAASIMTEEGIGSLLIHSPENKSRIVGIITDRDLRFKVVAAGLDYNKPVSEIMSSPVKTVLSQAVCFDVLLKMLSEGIHHLAVERSNTIIGVITSTDIMALQGSSPYSLFKEIIAQQEIHGLYPLAKKIPCFIRNLVAEGGKTSHITRMIAIINDHILDRILTLLEKELGPPPVSYCWLLMGSEGRREQTFKTDQDNAIIYADPPNDQVKEKAAIYFEAFADKAIYHLTECGYPPCPGEVMASNPKWRQPYSVWKKYFDSWMAAPDPQELVNATIFFDFKSGFGDIGLAESLRNYLIQRTDTENIFLYHLARYSLGSKAPLSFFRNFIVEKDGEHKRKLDIKTKGIALFTDFARILALRHGVKETNTLSRFEVLAAEKHIDDTIYQSAKEGYELMMQFRLIHQLQQIEDGIPPDNYINPAELSDLERRMLKECFRVIERLQSILELHYPAP